ncbi:uncharacterized protein LOC126576544 [Anopheles aquasalis]|uniref:uncharacterized protein LOC126576544 n=1 Tax=Anopheles aquasalis TaxID=42839 RepID=UPI00215A9680|nr:uncharacterized protein LOC126576544 [Anopheles aquasalis]
MDNSAQDKVIQKYENSKKYLQLLASLKEKLTDKRMVELYEEVLHDTFIETLRMSSDDKMLDYFERDELFSLYKKCRNIADEVKNELKLKAEAKVSSDLQGRTTSNLAISTVTVAPTCAAKDPGSAKPPGKSMYKFCKKRIAFLAQLRSIVTFESCSQMSRSERILRLIEEFETAIVTARLIAGEGDEEDYSLLGDGLLVSLAMSKLDEDSLAQLVQHKDHTIIPTWSIFREELLRLTQNSDSPHHQNPTTIPT